MLLERASVVLLGVAAHAIAGCGDVELRSHSRDAAVTVDGAYDDWDGKLTWVERARMSVGAQNDGNDLYIILVVGDREVQRSIMMSGMFLWFDAAGEKDRRFGIHYPLGIQDPSQFVRSDRGGDPAKLQKEFAERSLAEVELIGAGGELRMTRSPGNLPGVAVAVKRERGAMVLEYRIPLAATVDAPYGVGAPPGTSVGVGVMTPRIDLSKMRERMGDRGGGDDRGGGGVSGGGRGGMGGGRGGMAGGPRDGTRPEPPEAIDLWARLVLADAPTH